MVHALVSVVAILLQLAGLVGIVFPVLPGLPLVYAGLLFEGLIARPAALSPLVLIVFGLITVLVSLLEWVIRALGMRTAKLSKPALIGGLIGLVVGLAASPIGLWSIILLPPGGVIIGELLAGKSSRESWRSGIWSFIVMLLPMILNLLVAGAMISWFVAALF